jgi:transmembrane sensor
MHTPTSVAPSLLQEAAEQFVRVRTAAEDSEEHAQWLAWIEADPAHRHAFAEIQQAWDVAGEIKSPPWPRAEELSSPAPATFPRSFSRRPAWAVAASVAVAVAAFFTLKPDSGRDANTQFATARGEQKSTVLSDGSRIELGGQTSVAVNFTPAQRLVVAQEGEAFYNVAPDAGRPFVVQAGPVTVKALGTAFSIRHEGEAVSVVVTEGSVEVTCGAAHDDAGLKPAVVRAEAGERVRFDRGQRIPVVEPVKTELTNAWRRGRLRFENEPLRVVVATLNRYSSREIVLGDSALGELTFTGTVFDDRVEDWLTGVQVVFPVRLEDAGRGRVRIERN